MLALNGLGASSLAYLLSFISHLRHEIGQETHIGFEPLLVEFFLRKYAAENQRQVREVSPEALRPLVSYSWPGNVRELENVIERAVVLSAGPVITPELLPDHIAGRGS